MYFIASPEGAMQQNHLEVVLADLHGKFELVLEDYAALYAEMQVLRREAREQHELAMFLLRAIAADLTAHRAECGPHADSRTKPQGRLAGRTTHLSA
jgi:hypothetical protein